MANTRKSACQICRHPERARIEMAHVARCSLDAIARKFNVQRDAVWRHCKHHLSEEQRAQYLDDVPVQELLQRAADEGVGLMDYLRITRSIVLQQLQLAASMNDKHATASLSGRMVEVLREIGRMTGELMTGAQKITTINNTAILGPVFS